MPSEARGTKVSILKPSEARATITKKSENTTGDVLRIKVTPSEARCAYIRKGPSEARPADSQKGESYDYRFYNFSTIKYSYIRHIRFRYTRYGIGNPTEVIRKEYINDRDHSNSCGSNHYSRNSWVHSIYGHFIYSRIVPNSNPNGPFMCVNVQ